MAAVYFHRNKQRKRVVRMSGETAVGGHLGLEKCKLNLNKTVYDVNIFPHRMKEGCARAIAVKQVLFKN